MTRSHRPWRGLAIASMALGLTAWAGARKTAAPTPVVSVRLVTPVGTPLSKPGDPVSAVVLGLPDDDAPIPAGCVVTGRVLSSGPAPRDRNRHALALRFDTVRDRRDAAYPVAMTLVAVDNAREDVDGGVILGLPVVRVRPPVLETFLMLAAHAHPIALAAAEAVRLGVKAVERPAIAFGAGVRLSLAMERDPALRHLDCDGPRVAETAPDAATQVWVLGEPLRTQAGEPPRDADWINVIAVGSREAVAEAFRAAGWDTADRTSLRVDVRTFVAVVEHEQYVTGPVSRLRLEGVDPSMVFQKQTNTFAKRHHVRFWPARSAAPGSRVAWVGAATHDIGLEFSHVTKHYTHRIDGAIDDERHTLLTDLASANTVASYSYVPRAGVAAASINATGDRVTTDGRAAFVVLRGGLASARGAGGS